MTSFRNLADTVFLLASGSLALISVALISTTFSDHLRNYKYPSLQMCCLRILALAPVYAILSWLMMVFLPLAHVIEVFRDLYETYTLYCYWVLLVLWVGGQRRAIEILAGGCHVDCMVCPLLPAHGCPHALGCMLTRFQSAKQHFRYWRLAIFQWMLAKPSITLFNAILLSSGRGGAPHTKVLMLLSTAVGMQAVLDTYSCLLPHLIGLQGSTKFLCIKLLVGVTLLQQACINALVGYEVPDSVPRHGYSATERAQRLQSTVTIVEMAVFSLMLSVVFSRRSLQRIDVVHGAPLTKLMLPEGKEKGAQVNSGPVPGQVQVMHGASRSNTNDIVSRPLRGGGANEAQSAATEMDMDAEDDYGEQVSYRQILALWDVVLWQSIEDRHIVACSGRTSQIADREGMTPKGAPF
eukprot:jgi/Tetstr1/456000/TSEL_042778.t1